jgi:hypothetical protein
MLADSTFWLPVGDASKATSMMGETPRMPSAQVARTSSGQISQQLNGAPSEVEAAAVADIASRLFPHHDAPPAAAPAREQTSDAAPAALPLPAGKDAPPMSAHELHGAGGGGGGDASAGSPFEHVLLDAALQEVCRGLCSETEALRVRAYPVVDDLTHSVTREALIAVRGLKNAHQGLTARVRGVRDQLEQLTGARLWPPRPNNVHPSMHAAPLLTRASTLCWQAAQLSALEALQA